MKWIWLMSIFLIFVGMANFALADSSTLAVTLLNQDPAPARAGDTVILRFQIENTEATAANNVHIQFLEDYPFTVVSQNKSIVLSLNPQQGSDNYAYFQLTVKIDKDAIRSSYPIKLQITDASGSQITRTYSVEITNQDYAQIIYVDKAKLEPGKETDVNFTITNVGNSPLQNLVFSWDESTGAVLPVYSDDTRYIKYLDVGKSVQLQYTVVADVNAEPGLYTLNLNLEYQSANNANRSVIDSKAGVFVGGQTNFDLAFSESTAGQTSLSIANVGNNPALSVTVSIPDQPSFRVTGSNSAIIGNLDKGDYTLVSFQIASQAAGNFSGAENQGGQRNFSQFRNQTNGTQNANTLRVVIAYTDTTGQRVSVEKSIPIQLRATTGTAFNRNTAKASFIGSTFFWILLLVIMVIACFLYTRRIRNAKAKK
ncbi:hypothetical protein C4573_04155 [Candidatus Woesearchaeota archaeon]|nr:MAG: hypothetical protein C4573_04155 [Candidatus Woesearchaeota archaeon]